MLATARFGTKSSMVTGCRVFGCTAGSLFPSASVLFNHCASAAREKVWPSL